MEVGAGVLISPAKDHKLSAPALRLQWVKFIQKSLNLPGEKLPIAKIIPIFFTLDIGVLIPSLISVGQFNTLQ